MGGFSLGLHQAGIIPTHHYFSEIDTHAIANYRYNFKNAEYIGSVTDVRHIIRTIDRKPTDRLIITFGSPCQDFSLAGKRAGIEGSKSSLIKFAIFLIKRLRPDVYIWENVKGAYSTNNGADFWAIIQAFADIDGYGFEQQLVNTSWVLPQNRERIYLVGHLDGRSQSGVFPFGEDGKSHNDNKARSEPEAKLAATIGTREGQRKENNYVVTSNTTQGFEVANEGYSINFSNPNSKTRRGRVVKNIAQTLDTQANQGVIQINPNLESGGKQPYQQNRVYDEKGLVPALNAGKSDLIIKTGAIRGRGENNEQQLELRDDGNTNTLTSVEKDNVILTLQPSEINTKFATNYGQKNQTNARNLLSKLREEIGEAEITKWGFRIFDSLQKEKILQSRMYVRGVHKKGEEIQRDVDNRPLSFKKTQERFLREMWEEGMFGCSPQRWELAKQFFGQFANVMQKLPYQGTSDKKNLSSMRFTLLFDGVLHETLSKMEETWEPISNQGESIFGSNIRRLTEIETEILQGFCPDWTKFGIYHTKKGVETKQIPKTQRYKMCGNAVTATIVKIIAERIKFI